MKFCLPGLLAIAFMLSASAAVAQNATGTGQQASEPFSLSEGLATFDIEHQGDGSFAVRLLDNQGMLVEQLAQADGPFRGSKAVRIPRTGSYVYDVSATGPWSIRLRGTRDSAASPDMAPVYAGMQAARGKGTGGWLATGLLSGMVAGPIGAGINFAIASGRDTLVPADAVADVSDRGPQYIDAFSDAYRRRIRSNRRTAALIGGATGTAIFLFAIAQIVNWGDEGGTPPGGNMPEVP